MKSRIRTHKKRTREQTPDFSATPAQPMFQSRPFVVQTQSTQKSQQPDLKTSLMQAKRYGHHLSRIQPTGVSAGVVTQPMPIQRAIYLGSDKQRLETPQQEERKKKSENKNQKVEDMGSDPNRHFYFNDEQEMQDYASGKTETIGYEEKNQAWVRIPNDKLLVLGEDHSQTTLPDIVRATKTKKYIYEPYTEYPQELLQESKRLQQTSHKRNKEFDLKSGQKPDKSSSSHNAEKLLPKLIVALLGLRTKVNEAVEDVAMNPRNQGTRTSLRSSGKKRMNRILNRFGSGSATPQSNYERSQAELYYLRVAMLMATKAAKYQQNPQDLWNEHQEQFNTTAKQLKQGKELKNTEFIQSIVQGQFTYDAFLQSFKNAANAELQSSGKEEEFSQFEENKVLAQSGKVAQEDQQDKKKFENMREFYMYEKIKKAQEDGYLLAGIGYAHQRGLEGKLDNIPGIEVKAMWDFVDEQKAEHPQQGS